MDAVVLLHKMRAPKKRMVVDLLHFLSLAEMDPLVESKERRKQTNDEVDYARFSLLLAWEKAHPSSGDPSSGAARETMWLGEERSVGRPWMTGLQLRRLDFPCVLCKIEEKNPRLLKAAVLSFCV